MTSVGLLTFVAVNLALYSFFFGYLHFILMIE